MFSSEKHKEIRAQKAELGISEQTTNIAKIVAKNWKELPPDARAKWDELAILDKNRYEREKSSYTGPWKVAAAKRTAKDPTAPKRPMSAFFAFSNPRRGRVKKNNPEMDNSQLSAALAKQWKEAPTKVRQKYIDEELAKRNLYKLAMAEWKRNDHNQKLVQHQQSSEIAPYAVKALAPNVVPSMDCLYQQREDSNIEMIAWESIHLAHERSNSTLQSMRAAELANVYGHAAGAVFHQPAPALVDSRGAQYVADMLFQESLLAMQPPHYTPLEEQPPSLLHAKYGVGAGLTTPSWIMSTHHQPYGSSYANVHDEWSIDTLTSRRTGNSAVPYYPFLPQHQYALPSPWNNTRGNL